MKTLLSTPTVLCSATNNKNDYFFTDWLGAMNMIEEDD